MHHAGAVRMGVSRGTPSAAATRSSPSLWSAAMCSETSTGRSVLRLGALTYRVPAVARYRRGPTYTDVILVTLAGSLTP